MKTTSKKAITVKVVIQSPVEKVWELWTSPDHICKWNTASPEWHTLHATNDLVEGGKFSWRMEARDGSFGFDFSGVYRKIEKHALIKELLDDGRKVQLTFLPQGDTTEVIETFEAEETNTLELQKTGWQAILDNFKKYVEEFGNL